MRRIWTCIPVVSVEGWHADLSSCVTSSLPSPFHCKFPHNNSYNYYHDSYDDQQLFCLTHKYHILSHVGSIALDNFGSVAPWLFHRIKQSFARNSLYTTRRIRSIEPLHSTNISFKFYSRFFWRRRLCLWSPFTVRCYHCFRRWCTHVVPKLWRATTRKHCSVVIIDLLPWCGRWLDWHARRIRMIRMSLILLFDPRRAARWWVEARRTAGWWVEARRTSDFHGCIHIENRVKKIWQRVSERGLHQNKSSYHREPKRENLSERGRGVALHQIYSIPSIVLFRPYCIL